MCRLLYFSFACGASKKLTLVFKAFFFFLHKSQPDCAVIVEYYMLPGGISMLLWATCAGWRRPSVSSCCLETGGGHAVLHQMLLPSFPLLLLHFSTLTSRLSVCQHFPSGGVRHGVRVLGCQLPPARSVTSSPDATAPRASVGRLPVPAARGLFELF